MNSRLPRYFLFLGLSAAALPLGAQPTSGPTPQAVMPGTPPSSYALSGLDSLNYYNGNLVVKIPITNVGARGSATQAVSVPIQQRWAVGKATVSGATSLAPVSAWSLSPVQVYSPPWVRYRTAALNWSMCATTANFSPVSPVVTWIDVGFPDGRETILWDNLTNGQPKSVPSNPCSFNYTNFSRGTVFSSSDGSEMVFTSDNTVYDANNTWLTPGFGIPSGTLRMKDGTQYHFGVFGSVDYVLDRNGNRTSYQFNSAPQSVISQSVTDSAGRQQTYVVDYTGTNETDTITIPGYSQPVVVNYDRLANQLGGANTLYHSNFGGDTATATLHCLFPELTGASTTTVYNPVVVSSIVLPDNTSYTFKYNMYGELVLLTLPTGGAYAYTWNEASGCPNDSGGASGAILWPTTSSATIVRRPTARIEFADGANISARTVFSTPAATAGQTWAQVDYYDANGVTDSHLLRRETHYFYGDPTSPSAIPADPTQYPNWTDGLEFKTTVADATKTWQTQTRSWQQRPCNPTTENCSWLTNTNTPNSRIHDPQLCQVVTADDTGATSGAVLFYDTQFNNQTDVYEYGYGSGLTPGGTCPVTAPAGAFRHTQTAYATDVPHIAANLVSLPTSRTIFDTVGGSGGPVYQRGYEAWNYDEYTTYPLQDAGGTVGHDDADFGISSPSASRARGNVTSHQTGSSSASIETFIYDTTGSVVRHADFAGSTHTTYFCFDDGVHIAPNRIVDPRAGGDCASAGATPGKLGVSSFVSVRAIQVTDERSSSERG